MTGTISANIQGSWFILQAATRGRTDDLASLCLQWQSCFSEVTQPLTALHYFYQCKMNTFPRWQNRIYFTWNRSVWSIWTQSPTINMKVWTETNRAAATWSLMCNDLAKWWQWLSRLSDWSCCFQHTVQTLGGGCCNTEATSSQCVQPSERTVNMNSKFPQILLYRKKPWQMMLTGQNVRCVIHKYVTVLTQACPLHRSDKGFAALHPCSLTLTSAALLYLCGCHIYVQLYIYWHVIYRLWPVILCNSISQSEAELDL